MNKVGTLVVDPPRFTGNELPRAYGYKDQRTVDQFEDAWVKYFGEDPWMMPQGRKDVHCMEIEKELRALEISKRNVEKELQRQLDFFTESKKQLESNFTKLVASAATEQQEINTRLNRQVDMVAHADHNAQQAIPWEFFLKALDEAAFRSDTKYVDRSFGSMKPSTRAMFLVNGDGSEAESDKSLLLRAYRVDNALLKSQIKMLKKDITKHECNTETLEFLGRFLTENNIWGLLAK